MPGSPKLERIGTHPQSDLRQLEIQYNASVADDANAAMGMVQSAIWGWTSTSTQAAPFNTMGLGTTDTRVGFGAFRYQITGQAASEFKAAVAAGTAFGAATTPADQWAVFAFDIATGGTVTISAGAANGTTGYASEALALDATPYPVTVKARLGVCTVKTKAATAWIAATDSLAGGANGNVASITNYYPFNGIFAPTGLATGPNGVVTLGGAGVQLSANRQTAPIGTGAAWTGGVNGMLIPTVLARGSTDTQVSITACTYNAGGAADIAKSAVAAGVTFGALGTIPADRWGLIAMMINTQGTQSFLSAPANYTTGYASEAQAQGDLYKMFPAASLAFLGYVTIKTKVGSPFVVATDGLAGGASNNVASATNYYPTAGWVQAAGNGAGQIATREGKVLTAQYY